MRRPQFRNFLAVAAGTFSLADLVKMHGSLYVFVLIDGSVAIAFPYGCAADGDPLWSGVGSRAIAEDKELK
jgi:hypothetical protein